MGDLISVIVPAYNIREYLLRCLESLLTQTYENLEILVVDDGSSDGTASVADAYAQKDRRIKVIRKENGGVTSARLRGVAEATGDWIGFVDGDDYCEQEMYARLLENAVAYGADISHCGYRMVFPSHVDWYYNTGKTTVQAGKQGMYDLLDGSFVEPGLVNKLYRRELFSGLVLWMDKSIRINEDLLMNYYLFRLAKMAIHEDVCPYHYILRQGSASVSQLNEHKLKDPVRVLDIMLAQETDAQARAILERRLVYQLIGAATMSLGEHATLIRPWRTECQKRLRAMVARILGGTQYPTKLKLMALWAAIWPWSYGFVHRVYAKITGLDKKYCVE